MAALTTSTPRTLSNTSTYLAQLGASKVFAGSYLSLSSGKTVTLAGAFVGIALETRDPAEGYSTIPVAYSGLLHEVAVTGASTASNIGAAVYAVDGGSLSLTASGNYAVGEIIDFNPVTSKFTVSFRSANAV